MSRFLLLLALLFGVVAYCVADEVPKAVSDALHSVAPNAKIESHGPSSLPGFYSVIVDGHVLYVSMDGKYLIEGLVFDVARKVDLKSERLSQVRKEGLGKIPANRRLVFAPPHPKYKVTVFTDVDCPYCRQFHKQIADYNRLGIEIDYVLFPLTIHPGADKKAEAVWCAADRNTAYTDAMNGKVLEQKTCNNPISELTNAAMSMGLSGTPAIITDDGTELGGYVAPADLAQRLDSIEAHAQKAPN
jgi:thiol:disulfide interchange protein DsbC